MATTHSQQIVQKLWNYCNLLRDDGLSYSEQLNVSVGTGFRRAAAMRQSSLLLAFSGRLVGEQVSMEAV